ncbi:MAG: MFS transporter [Eubacteriales bacterium]
MEFFSTFKKVFSPRDEHARGRLCIMLSGILSSIAAQFTGGVFYTGFLLLYGIDVVSIGILTFIPSLACLLNIFSPSILERFRKRKWLLAGVRILTNTINILGITFLPVLVRENRARIIGFIVIVALANSISALFGSGYSAWHAKFLTEDTRSTYFMFSGCINSLTVYLFALIGSVITDKLAGSPGQLSMMTTLRIISYILTLVDTLLLCIPKEYEYETSGEKVKLADVFTKPVRNKAFFCSMIILFLYGFTTNMPNATINAYLIDDVHISYTFMNAINATYFIFFIVFGKMWNKFIAENTWFRALAIACVLQGATYLVYAFVNEENSSWLYLAVRLSQHVLGVVMNTIIASLPYINLPEKDRTNYLSFYLIVNSLAAFSGMMFGTLFTSLMGDRALNFFGFPLSAAPLLLIGCWFMHYVTAFVIMRLLPIVTPKYHYPAPAKK